MNLLQNCLNDGKCKIALIAVVCFVIFKFKSQILSIVKNCKASYLCIAVVAVGAYFAYKKIKGTEGFADEEDHATAFLKHYETQS